MNDNTIFLFKNISKPVKTWGEFRGRSIVADVLAYRLGCLSDCGDDDFYEIKLAKGGEVLQVTPDDYASAKPATKYDLHRAGIKKLS